MLGFLLKLKDMLSSLGLSLSDLMELVQDLFDLGAPPELEDKAAFQAWMVEAVDVLTKISAKTTTDVDDKVAKFLSSLVANSAAWELAYLLIGLLMKDESEAVVVLATANELCSAVEDEAKLDPATIILIIQAVVEIIKLWRNRK